jgi:hypothetical protein
MMLSGHFRSSLSRGPKNALSSSKMERISCGSAKKSEGFLEASQTFRRIREPQPVAFHCICAKLTTNRYRSDP